METIPLKWRVKKCPEVGAYYDRKCRTRYYSDINIFTMLYSHNICGESILKEGRTYASFEGGDFNVPEITLEQFRQLTNTQNQTVMEKCIIGSKELKNYLQGRNDNPRYLDGDKAVYYYQDKVGNWRTTSNVPPNFELVSFTEYFKQSNTNPTMDTQPTTAKPMSITKTETVLIGKKKREITITVLTEENNPFKLRAGYSVRNPEDKKSNPELGKQISIGRAMSDKTNMVDMYIGEGMQNKKYILYAIAEQLFRELSSGTRKIKGVK